MINKARVYVTAMVFRPRRWAGCISRSQRTGCGGVSICNNANHQSGNGNRRKNACSDADSAEVGNPNSA